MSLQCCSVYVVLVITLKHQQSITVGGPGMNDLNLSSLHFQTNLCLPVLSVSLVCRCWKVVRAALLITSHLSATPRWKKLITPDDLMHFAVRQNSEALRGISYYSHLSLSPWPHPLFISAQTRNVPASPAVACTSRSPAKWALRSAAQPCRRRSPPCLAATAAPRPNMTADR